MIVLRLLTLGVLSFSSVTSQRFFNDIVCSAAEYYASWYTNQNSLQGWQNFPTGAESCCAYTGNPQPDTWCCRVSGGNFFITRPYI